MMLGIASRKGGRNPAPPVDFKRPPHPGRRIIQPTKLCGQAGQSRELNMRDIKAAVLSYFGIECWKNVPGYESLYEVSNLGRIYSTKTGTYLKPTARASDGYCVVSLYDNGRAKKFLIHRLVLLAFDGDSDLETRHLNGKKINNQLCNLLYGTSKENAADRERHGIKTGFVAGHRFSPTTLSLSKVKRIKRHLSKYAHVKGIVSRLAARHNVSHSTISRIKTGRSWT